MKKSALLIVLLPFLVVIGTPGIGFSAVAIGYDYSKAPGDPNFSGFILPTGIGDNLFDLYLFNGTEYLFEAQVTGGVPYLFDQGGVDRFRILGIEASAGLDPNDPEAFNIDIVWVEGDHIEIVRPIIGTVFSDVPIGYWAEEAIMAIYDAGITGGCSQNPLNYCPAGIVTRGQMAVFIETLLGHASSTCTNQFADVLYSHPFCRFIERLASDGITGGCGGGNYCPDDPVTREQMAVFLTKALEMVPEEGYCRVTNPFTDVDCGRWTCDFVKRFSEMGITAGYGDGNFGPGDPLRRDQMAVFLSRTLTVQERQRECSTTGYCYAEGGELSVTDPGSCSDGVRILIPPGALDVVGDERRVFWIEDNPDYGQAPFLPPGFIAYPNQFNPCGFALETGFPPPYNVGLEFHFPVQGMVVGPGEIASAFAYDERVGKWRIVLPESTDGSTMTVKANYRMIWKWGKISVKDVDVAYLIPVAEEKYGVETFNAMVERIREFYNQREVQELQPSCASLKDFRDKFLEGMKQATRQRLETYQTQFGDCVICRRSSGCSTCNVLSHTFFEESLTYLYYRLEMELIEILTGNLVGPALTGASLGDVLLLLRYMYDWEKIYSLGCDYGCISEKGGLDFWIDYAVFHMCEMGQAVITIAINEGWVCP